MFANQVAMSKRQNDRTIIFRSATPMKGKTDSASRISVMTRVLLEEQEVPACLTRELH
jgi:hypothetical protein